MLLRRLTPLALASVLVACPSVDRDGPPQRVAIAVFDTTNSVIPLPNDLALQRQAVGPVPGTFAALQQELLFSFREAGGFPADQEVAATIPIRVRTRQADGSFGAPAAPAGLDEATLTDANLAVVRLDTGARLQKCTSAPGTAPAAPCFEATYSAASGNLTIRRNGPDGSRRWDAGGRYLIATRAAIRTSDGLTVGPDAAIALVAPDRDLANPENQPPGGLPAATVAQLNGLRGLYNTPRRWDRQTLAPVCAASGLPAAPCWAPGPDASGMTAAFAAVSTVFPREELASIQTFAVQPAAAVRPLTDTGSGQLPLPSDFLLGADGKVRNVPAFGAAAAGLATLDGFSTTAPHFLPLSGPVDATTLRKPNVRIYKLPNLAQPLFDLTDVAGGNAPRILTQPPTSVANGQASTIVLAPAVAVEGVPGLPNQYVPPLDERSQYLVVVTSDVKDPQGNALRRSSLMDLVFSFSSPLCTPTDDLANCTSQIPGVANADAAGLQRLRDALGPALDALGLRTCGGASPCAVLAYTVTTQSVTGTSLSLAAAPYGIENGAGQAIFRATAAPAPFTPDPAAPTTNVAGFFTIPFNSVDGIDKTTGAFRPTLQADLADPATLQTLLAPLTALVAVPDAAVVPACPSPPFPAGARCAKLVVFGHGLNGNKEQMVAVASSLASRGFVAAAIDFPLHGSRNWCSASTDCVVPGTGADGTCAAIAGAGGQGDATPPGVCAGGSVPRTAASRHFITGNFFRMRDALRQNVLDQSALVLALSRPPTGVPQIPAGQDPVAAMLPAGVIIDPSAIYYEGLSLGGIGGTQVVATNPRITRAALAAGGGTFADIGVTSLAFQPGLAPVIGALIGVPGFSFALVDPASPAFNPAVAAGFQRLVHVAKWILDPAEAVNYSPRVRTSPLPNLLANPDGSVAQSPKDVWAQISTNDSVVPNPTNRLLYSLMAVPTTTYSDADAPNGTVAHSILATSLVVQGDASGFLLDLTTPPAAVTLP